MLRLHTEEATDGAFASRIGGEEFVVVVPALDQATAIHHCERIRAHLEATDWSMIAPGLSVTASVGVAVDRGGTEPGSELLSRADARLYEAKRHGRNRVVSDPHPAR